MHRLAISVLVAAIAAGCSAEGRQGESTESAPVPALVATADAGARAGQRALSGGAAPGASASSLTAAPAAGAVPSRRFREVVVPGGTRLNLQLSTPVASDTSKVEDQVSATLAQPLVVDGTTVLPAGTIAIGTVVAAERSGRVKGRASIAIRFHELRAEDESYAIRSSRIAREAEATKGEDAAKVGIGAGAGALVGAVAGGKKGAVVGGAVGAGAGTGVVLATRGEEVRLGAGARLTATLTEPLRLTIPD